MLVEGTRLKRDTAVLSRCVQLSLSLPVSTTRSAALHVLVLVQLSVQKLGQNLHMSEF